MEYQESETLDFINFDTFSNIMNQIPKGKVTTVRNLLQFLNERRGRLCCMDFIAYSQDPRWLDTPWWRIISENGEMVGGVWGLVAEEAKFFIDLLYLQMDNPQ